MPISVANKPNYPFCLNRTSIQSRGLFGWWPGGPSGGPRLFDQSGKGNHGTIVGTVPTTGFWSPGYGGGRGAIIFDGSTNYVSIPNFSVASNADFSISCWFNCASFSANRIFIGNASDAQVAIGFLASNTSVFVRSSGLNFTASFTVPALSTNTWYHFLFTGYAGIAHLYINGIESSTGGVGANNWTWTINQIGGYITTSLGWLGLIEDMRFYNNGIPGSLVKSFFSPFTRWQLRYQSENPKYFSAVVSSRFGRLVNINQTVQNASNF